MCFPRKLGLGHYNATREEWLKAYRIARVRHRAGRKPDPRRKGVSWKAQLIVSYERDATDALSVPLANRLAGHHFTQLFFGLK
jgi:hypothetical protein